MNSLTIVNQRVGRVLLALGLLFASILPALMPSFASAAQITSRSIALSSSAADASGVTYQVQFTGAAAAGAVVLEFCNDSPLLGATCTAPGGFSLSSATATGGTIDATHTTASKITLTSSITTSNNTITISNVHNPTANGPLYARIVTYTDLTGAQTYTTATPGTHIDDGGVAMYITNKIGVSAAVLESMVFCVSGATITENCGGSLTAPSLKLGQSTGGVIALDSQNIYTGDVYTQLSTNASSGAVVSLKSSAAGCGGLIRAGAATPAAGCGIAPALAGGITAGQAKFGVKTATAVGAGTNYNGVLQPYGTLATTPYYSNSVYKLKYNSTDQSDGVTSTYGDPFLETAGAPVNNMGMQITFGASAANNTPAGNYSADLSLIATGTF